eukprot:6183092-Pleurochrysis_carterae.AAC.1
MRNSMYSLYYPNATRVHERLPSDTEIIVKRGKSPATKRVPYSAKSISKLHGGSRQETGCDLHHLSQKPHISNTRVGSAGSCAMNTTTYYSKEHLW